MQYKLVKTAHDRYKLIHITNTEAQKLYKESTGRGGVLGRVRKGAKLWTAYNQVTQ